MQEVVPLVLAVHDEPSVEVKISPLSPTTNQVDDPQPTETNHFEV
jgi:hypothetical protein